MKIEQAIKEYLIEIEVRQYSPRTIKGYRNNLNLFLRFCHSVGVENVEEITLATVRQLVKMLTASHRKGTYINGILKGLKSFIQYCYGEGYGAFNTKGNFIWCKEEKPVITPFTPEQVKRMMKNCSGNSFKAIRDRAILTMFFETGIRCLELCSIKPEDVHEDYIIINGKNHKQRVVPITPVLRKAMMKYESVRESYFLYKKTDDYYFLSFHGKMLTVTAVEIIVKLYGEGIEDVRVSPHTCRHFFAQQHVKMGTDLYTISRLLGHENIQITQTYLKSLRDRDIVEIAKGRSVLMAM